MAKATKLEWAEIDTDQLSETVSEDDIKNAENGGRPGVGLYLCVCEKSSPKQVNPDDKPSYLAVGLGWKIERTIELNGVKVTGDEGEAMEGRFIWDDISLPSAGEADGVRSRRILVAKRCGIIKDGSNKIPSDAWSNLIIGKRALIRLAERSYKDKNGNDRTIVAVPFDGYDYASKVEAIADADFGDI